MGREGDEVHQRARLHALRPAADLRPGPCAAPTTSRTVAARRCTDSSWATPTNAPKTVAVEVDVHSELLGAYPVGLGRRRGARPGNLADTAAYENGALVFTDKGALPGADAHDYAALAAWTAGPEAGETGPGFRGPQPGAVCAADDSTSPPSACDDGPYGKGAGGQLRYRVTVGARDRRDGLDRRRRLGQGCRGGAPRTRRRAARPRWPARAEGRLARAGSARRCASSISPVTASCRRPSTGASRTSPTSRRPRPTCKIRFVDQGKQYPPPVTTLRERHLRRRRLSGLPVAVRHRRRVHRRSRRSRVGQFEAIKEHLIALRDISDALNARSGQDRA